jgi:predicted amidohydrolase
VTQLTVGLVQFDAHPLASTNLATALRLSETVINDGADLIIPQELVSTQYFPAFPVDDSYFDLAEPIDGPTVSAFRKLAVQGGVGILVPWFERVQSGRYFNTACLVDESGAIIGIWRKAHIPRVQVPSSSGTREVDEKYYFEEGREPYEVVTWRGVRIGVMICHDRHFPEIARVLAMAGADLLLVPSTSRGIPDSIDPVRMWRTELGATAFQNCVYVAATNRTGHEGEQVFLGSSLVCSPSGEEILSLGTEESTGTVRFDSAESERVRRARGFFRDRRPDLYGSLALQPGAGPRSS